MTAEKVKFGNRADSLREQLTKTTFTLKGSELRTMRLAIRSSLLRNLIQNYHTLVVGKYTDIAPRLEVALEQNK